MWTFNKVLTFGKLIDVDISRDLSEKRFVTSDVKLMVSYKGWLLNRFVSQMSSFHS